MSTLSRWFAGVYLVLLIAGVGGQEVPRDCAGDPLPPGAVLRVGTTRWRVGTDAWALAVSPDGKTVAAAGKESGLWDAATGKLLRRLTALGGPDCRVAFTPDGKTVILSGNTSTEDPLKPSPSLSAYEVATGRPRFELKQGEHIFGMAVSPDSRRLALAVAEGVRLRDPVSG